MSSKVIKDDVMIHMENDLEKIQAAVNMYISYKGSKGSLHLAKELLNNHVDEAVNKLSECTTMNVYFNESTGLLRSSDDGRGIPFGDMVKACTNLQSSTKFGRMGGIGASAGQNGAGLKATNALSSYFQMISYRGDEKRCIEFENAVMLNDTDIIKTDEYKTGTTFSFVPNPKWLGKDCNIKTDQLIGWMDKLSYLIPEDLTMDLFVEKVGKEASVSKEYVNRGGMKQYINDLKHKNLMSDTFSMDGVATMEDDRFIDIDLAFSFSSEIEPNNRVSFCNYVETIDGGTHVRAVETAIGTYLANKTRDSLTDKEKGELKISSNDVLTYMNVAFNLKTNLQPEFTGQTKEKVGNDELFEPIRNLVRSRLDSLMKSKPKELNNIIKVIKSIAKARYESTKIRQASIKGPKTNLDRHGLKPFEPAVNSKGKEIFLIEGDSAKGSAEQARNPYTQALLSFRGIPMNALSKSYLEVLENLEFKLLIDILGLKGVRRREDILNSLEYDKHIIMADGDVDGKFITSLICVFFITHYPEIIEAGMLYKAVPPLYKLTDNRFVIGKKQIIELMEDKASKSVNLYNSKGKILPRGEVRELLFRNRSYLEELTIIAKNTSADKFLIELLTYAYDKPNMLDIIRGQYDEVFYNPDNKKLTVVVDGRIQTVFVSAAFKTKARRLKELITLVNGDTLMYQLEVKDKRNGDDDKGIMTLGNLLTILQQYRPEIGTRYKGLGELDPEELWETTMNPDTRSLVRLTMEDVQREVELFTILHGENMSSEKKRLLDDFEIDREDLDN